MDDYFLLLAGVGWAGFAILGVMGFMSLRPLPRAGVLLGTIASAMLAAAQGCYLYLPLFPLFPGGLAHFLMGSVNQLTEACFFVGAYLIYISLSVACFLTRPAVARICWGVLVGLLLMNIAGCQQGIEEAGRTLLAPPSRD